MPRDIALGATSINPRDAGARSPPPGCPGEGIPAVPCHRHEGDGAMHAAIAVPGNASTILTHVFGLRPGLRALRRGALQGHVGWRRPPLARRRDPGEGPAQGEAHHRDPEGGQIPHTARAHLRYFEYNVGRTFPRFAHGPRPSISSGAVGIDGPPRTKAQEIPDRSSLRPASAESPDHDRGLRPARFSHRFSTAQGPRSPMISSASRLQELDVRSSHCPHRQAGTKRAGTSSGSARVLAS